jgi:small subunit ribosomal protein S18
MSKSKNLLNKERYCYFCINVAKEIDFKNWQMLQRFISSYGKIVPRRRSGVCMKHQRKLATAIKQARYMALLPYITR